MKNQKIIVIVLMASASSVSMASGTHGGGHGHASKSTDNAHWLAPKSAAAISNPIKMTRQSVESGHILYQKNCASCHGASADGKGMAGMMMNPKPADLQAMAGSHPDGDFAYKINTGRGAMPSWKHSLKESEVWHLVNFIQSLEKVPFARNQLMHDNNQGHKHDS